MLDVNAIETVAANVRREMKARGWTQTELAEAAEMHQSQIAELLAGKTDHRLTTLEKLATAFGITVSAILMPVPESEPEKTLA
jgi:transcriptional regulator with XRE-family HTH domain